MRKKKNLPEIKNVKITGVAAEGKAVARIPIGTDESEGIVVFIPYGVPGDIVDIKIDKKKHNYAEAHITKIVKPSPLRINPKCNYFGVCGGCKWQQLPYEEQLKFKRQTVVDSLERIAKIDFPTIPAALGSEEIWSYRNKMEYSFSNRRWKSWEEMNGEITSELTDNALGFHIPGSFDKILHIEKCWLQEDLGNRLRNFIYKYALEHNLTFYDIKGNSGFLRNMVIRMTSTGESMVIMIFGEKDEVKIKELLSVMVKEFPEITDIEYTVNLKLNDSIADQEIITYKGRGYIEEKMGHLIFRISPKSFYQTNSRQAEILYKTASEFAGLSDYDTNEKPLVYDLYTGAGTIANYVAKNASKVIGIEYVEDAVKDARINSVINKINNTEFYAGDMKDILTDAFIQEHGKPDIIIVDPPRAGMHKDVVDTLIKTSPNIIVYVSCNPATQARDLALLNISYEVTKVQPVDMFPHTHHIENVVKLEKTVRK